MGYRHIKFKTYHSFFIVHVFHSMKTFKSKDAIINTIEDIHETIKNTPFLTMFQKEKYTIKFNLDGTAKCNPNLFICGGIFRDQSAKSFGFFFNSTRYP